MSIASNSTDGFAIERKPVQLHGRAGVGWDGRGGRREEVAQFAFEHLDIQGSQGTP